MNKLRPELFQAVSDPAAAGEARFFHTNAYAGARTSETHSKNDLPPALARDTRKALLGRLQAEGWDRSKTKILMLTHNVLAAEQGYDATDRKLIVNPAEAETVAVCIAIFLATLMSLYAYVSMLRGNRQRQEANDWLEREGGRVASSFTLASPSRPELSHDELKQMRFLLDRALQPIDEFNGFEWLDQFQTAAIRYQLNFIGYAFAMAQATYLPAFQGYIIRIYTIIRSPAASTIDPLDFILICNYFLRTPPPSTVCSIL